MPRTVIGASAVVPFLQCCRAVTSNDAGSVLVSVAKSSNNFFMEAISLAVAARINSALDVSL